jgi:hypothetical protein
MGQDIYTLEGQRLRRIIGTGHKSTHRIKQQRRLISRAGRGRADCLMPSGRPTLSD